VKEPAYVAVNGDKVDGSLVFLPVKISHGRSDTNVQPDAPVAEFSTWGPDPVCAKGDRLEIVAYGTAIGGTTTWDDPNATWATAFRSWLGEPILEYQRFTGSVTNVKAVEEGGEVVEWEVRAIGTQATLGLQPVKMNRPQENDVERVLAIAQAAGVVVNIAGDPSLTLAPDTIDQSALSAIQQVCSWTGGLFWQTKGGEYVYGTSSHRAGTSDTTLPAATILDGLEWSSDVAEVLNHLTVEFPRPRTPPGSGTGGWDWSSNTTIADPGAGNMRTNANPLRVNPRDLPAITYIALSAITNGGTDVSVTLREYPTGTVVYLQDKADSSKWAAFRMTDPPVDEGGWFRLAVTFLQSGTEGTVTNNSPMILAFDTTGLSENLNETYVDEDSVAQWGRRHADLVTRCADEQEAGVFALTVLARRSQPFWSMPGVLVPMDDVPAVQAVAINNLEVSAGVLVPVPVKPGNTPAPIDQWAVEGWVEEFTDDGRWLQFALSDWARFSSAILRTYAVVRDTLTYQQAAAKTYQRLIAEVT